MRLSALLAATALVAPGLLHAQAAGWTVYASGLPAGTPTSITVLANGWQAQLRYAGVTCSGSQASYALNPDSTPKVSGSITSASWSTAGAATTINRNVVGTISLRQAYPNQTLPTETQSGPDCLATIALSDYVDAGDTGTFTFLTGSYTGALSATLTAINNSAHAADKPVCKWDTPAHQVISPSAVFTVEVECAHVRPQQLKQVNAVKFDMTDGTNHVTAFSTAMTASAIPVSGPPVYVFSYSFAAGAFAGLTSGACASGATCETPMDFTAYPFTGPTLTASSGQDGVAIAASTLTPNLHAQNFVFDQANKHSPIYGWISTAGTVGTCSTTGCIATTATDPGTAATANYASFQQFAVQCQAYNNANRGHNDTSGCVGEVRANAAINGFDPSASLTATTAGLSWLKFIAAPGQTNATVVIKPASASTGSTNARNRLWLENIGLAQADTAFAAYNGVLQGPDHSGTTLTTEVVCKGCAVTSTASGFPMVYGVPFIHWINPAIDVTANGACGVTCSYSTDIFAADYFSGTIKAPPTLQVLGYNMSGVTTTGGEVTIPNTSGCFPRTGIFNAFNIHNASTTPLAIFGGTNACTPTANFADVQNVYEKTTVDGGVSHQVFADGDETPLNNYIEEYNTIAGGRENICYNDGTGPTGAAKSTPKSCQREFVVLDPMSGQGENNKSDTFPTGNAARIGNWPVRFGVGSIGLVFKTAANGDAGPGVFAGDYMGRTGSSTANNFAYNQTVTFTTNASASGTNAGGGNYKPTGGSASPAYGRVPSGMAGFPGDITGAARRNDGTGCAGAIEC